MITHVKFVGVPVKDQQRALTFYTEKLGFAIATDQPMGPGARWIELRVAHSTTRLVLFTPPGHEDRVGTFFNGSLACDDVAATFRQLQQRGVEFVEPPTEQPWGTFAKFKDSEGNTFVLSSSWARSQVRHESSKRVQIAGRVQKPGPAAIMARPCSMNLPR